MEPAIKISESIAETAQSVASSFVVLVFCYLYLLYFELAGYKTGKATSGCLAK